MSAKSDADAVALGQNWAEVTAWRKRTRSELLKARTLVAADLHSSQSEKVMRRLIAMMDSLPHIKLVGVYWPIQREIEVLPFVDYFLASGGAAALPVIKARSSPLEFRRWKPGDAMASGVYDIPYPAGGEVVEPDALVVPLVGFDEGGYRLGYGGGYYDRTLAAMPKRPLTIGVGSSAGRLETIYPQAFDVPMDYILTEEATVRLSDRHAR